MDSLESESQVRTYGERRPVFKSAKRRHRASSSEIQHQSVRLSFGPSSASTPSQPRTVFSLPLGKLFRFIREKVGAVDGCGLLTRLLPATGARATLPLGMATWKRSGRNSEN